MLLFWHHIYVFHKLKKIFFIIINQITMGSLLYFIALFLLITWGVGFFVYNVGGAIHILFVVAIIAIVVRIFKGI